MSAPQFEVLAPPAPNPNNAVCDVLDSEQSQLANDVICQVDGTVDNGSDYDLVAIFVHNTDSPLAGSDTEKEQAVRDAQHQPSVTSGTWTYDGSLAAYRGQTNYFHAVADFSPQLASGDPVTLSVLNRPWTPQLVNSCPEQAHALADTEPSVVEAEKPKRGGSAASAKAESPKGCCGSVSAIVRGILKAVTRTVDVRPLEEVTDNGLWLRYVLFNKNGLDGNRLMLSDGVTPLRAKTIAVAATAVDWRASIGRNQIHQRPDGLSDTSHTEPGSNPGSQVPMRFPGQRKFSLGVLQKIGVSFNHRIIHAESRANPDLIHLDLNSDVLIQHNSNLFNIYGHTLQGRVEICVKIEA